MVAACGGAAVDLLCGRMRETDIVIG